MESHLDLQQNFPPDYQMDSTSTSTSTSTSISISHPPIFSNEKRKTLQKQCIQNIKVLYNILVVHLLNNEDNYKDLNILRRIFHILNFILRMPILHEIHIEYISKFLNDLKYKSPWDNENPIYNSIDDLSEYSRIYMPNNHELNIVFTEVLTTTIKDEALKLIKIDFIDN